MVKNIIGLDIGGSKIEGVVFNGKKAIRSLRMVTPRNLKDFQYSLKKLVEYLSSGLKIYGIGIGMAGTMNVRAKTAASSPNIKFIKDFNFKQLFPRAKKLALENDANCFALAESLLGQGRGLQNFIGVTLGTGIGGGLISNHQIYRGFHGGAGEVGHMMTDMKHTYEHYFKIARDNNNYVRLGEIVGSLFIGVTRVIDTGAIILGGSVTENAHRHFLTRAMLKMNSELKPDLRPKILVSKLKYAGALGAALLLK